MIFNSTPKTGSDTIWTLLDYLSTQNNFSSYTNSYKVKKQRGFENIFLAQYKDREFYVNMLNRGMVRVPSNKTKYWEAKDIGVFICSGFFGPYHTPNAL